jgi:hypothetical protein
MSAAGEGVKDSSGTAHPWSLLTRETSRRRWISPGTRDQQRVDGREMNGGVRDQKDTDD